MGAPISKAVPAGVRRVVVGFDGSVSGDAALKWAAEEAGLLGAPLEVWAVVEPPRLGHHAESGDSDDSDPGLDGLRAAAEKIAAGTGADLRVGRGGAAAVLCEASNPWDLLVVGSRGRNPFTGLMLGSTSRACLHHAPCSVVVVRPASRPPRPHGRVVVGIDSSGPARRALHVAAGEALLRGAELDVIHAVQWDQLHEPQLIAPVTRHLVSWTKELVGQELAESGVAGHALVVNGNPADALVRHSANADLLVLGSRGHNPLATLVVGSTSDYCARHAECPVMIVRPDPQVHDDTAR
jgi:nucleotide-binding universal stress UspA family protein